MTDLKKIAGNLIIFFQGITLMYTIVESFFMLMAWEYDAGIVKVMIGMWVISAILWWVNYHILCFFELIGKKDTTLTDAEFIAHVLSNIQTNSSTEFMMISTDIVRLYNLAGNIEEAAIVASMPLKFWKCDKETARELAHRACNRLMYTEE